MRYRAILGKIELFHKQYPTCSKMSGLKGGGETQYTSKRSILHYDRFSLPKNEEQIYSETQYTLCVRNSDTQNE